MTEDDLLKVVIGLVSAFSGWILAQLTSGLKTFLNRRKVKKLLLEELLDLKEEIGRLLHFYARQLEMHGAKCISSETSIELTNPIYQNYYKEALLALNQKQRISFQMIHGLVDNVNQGINEFRELTSEAQSYYIKNGYDEEISKFGEAWGNLAKVEFGSCAALQWQINFHLRFPNGPDLSPYTKEHESYLKFLDGIRSKVQEYIDNGKTIDREKFERVYDPSIFSSADS